MDRTYSPLSFFMAVFTMTWISWFIAAYLSYTNPNQDIYTIALMPGLVAPFLISVVVLCLPKNRENGKDFIRRIIELKRIHIPSLVLNSVVMSAILVLAILISPLFGQSLNQLAWADSFTFSAGSASVVLVLISAPILEEIGWHGYGVDGLFVKSNLFTSSLIFGILWSLWHLPLMFVKDYSMNVLLQQSIWYALNFFVSVIPLGFIINWVYIKSKRSIPAVILFHLFINIIQTSTKMNDFTGCIQTVLIIAYAVILVLRNKNIFFQKGILVLQE